MRDRLAKIRLIVSDMDGTLLDGNNALPPRTAQAIRDLEISGRAKFALGTGRSRNTASFPFPESFGFFGRPGIFLNGAQVHGLEGALLHENLIGSGSLPILVNSLAQFFPEILSLIICSGDRCIAYPDISAFSMYLTARFSDPAPSAPLESLESLWSRANMVSILVKHPDRDMVWLKELVSEIIAPLNLRVTQSLANLLTVIPPGTSKASGVVAIAASFGLELSEVAVIGDAHNDLEMLRVAGLAVAVGNAVREVKEAAHWVVNSHDDAELPGVAQLIESILSL